MNSCAAILNGRVAFASGGHLLTTKLHESPARCRAGLVVGSSLQAALLIAAYDEVELSHLG